MNKNISFFIALSFFNLAFTNETIDNSSEETVIIENKKSIPTHNLTIKIKSKNDDSTLFNEKSHELLNIIQNVHRSQNSSNLYNQILNFIKETQEAILAGYNLITTASTATPLQLFSAVEALTEEKTSEENQVENSSSTKNSDSIHQDEESSDSVSKENETLISSEEKSDNESTETVTQEETADQEETAVEEKTDIVNAQHQAIELSINIFLEKEEDKDLFNTLVSKMDTLALFLNEGSHSAEEITTLFNDVILAAHHLPNTNLTIKIV